MSEDFACKESDRDHEATGKLVSLMFSGKSLCLRQLLSHVLEASSAESCGFAVHEPQDGGVPFAPHPNGKWLFVCEEINQGSTSRRRSKRPIEAYLAQLNKGRVSERPEPKLQDGKPYLGEVMLRNRRRFRLVIQPLVSDILGNRRSSRLCLFLLNPSLGCIWSEAEAGTFGEHIQPMAAPVQTWLWWVHYQRARLQDCCRRMAQGIGDQDLANSIFHSLVRLHTLGDIVTYANKGLLLHREQDKEKQDKWLKTYVLSAVCPSLGTDECWHNCLQPPWPACHDGKEADRKLAAALLGFCPWTSGARRECAQVPEYFRADWPQIVRDRLWGCTPPQSEYVERQGVDPHFLDKGALSRFFAAEYLAANMHSAYVNEGVKYLGNEERGRSLAHMGRVFQHLLAKTPLDWRTIEGLVWMISEYSHDHLQIDPRLDIAAHLLQAARNEPALHAMRDFYRDHFIHAIEVCFLGHLLLITYGEDGEKPLWLHVVEQPGFPQKPSERSEELDADAKERLRKEVLRQWYVAALLHDVGYAIDIFRALGRMLEFYSLPKEMEPFRENLKDAFSVLSDSCPMKEMASLLGLEGADDLGQDHGVIAATHLKSLLRQLERDKKPGSYGPAIRAIGVHNDRRASVNFETDPLGVLLILCDTIQEWGRPYLRYATTPSMLLARLLAVGGDQEDITGSLRTVSLNMTRCGDPAACPEFRLDGDSLTVDLAYDEGIQDNAGVFNLWIDASCNLQRLILDSFPFDIKISFKTPWFRVLGRDPQSQMWRLRDAAAETHMHFLRDWLPSSSKGLNVTSAVRHSLEEISEDFGFDILTLDLRRLAKEKVIAGDVDRFRDRLRRWKRFNEDRDFEGDYSPLIPGKVT